MGLLAITHCKRVECKYCNIRLTSRENVGEEAPWCFPDREGEKGGFLPEQGMVRRSARDWATAHEMAGKKAKPYSHYKRAWSENTRVDVVRYTRLGHPSAAMATLQSAQV